jgi:hypothetical protein
MATSETAAPVAGTSAAPTWWKEIKGNDFVELPMTARHSLAAAYLPRGHGHGDPGSRHYWPTVRTTGVVGVSLADFSSAISCVRMLSTCMDSPASQLRSPR